MIFTSLNFALFFLVLLWAYWALPRRGQNALLLAGSYLFYGWVHPWFVLLIAATTHGFVAASNQPGPPAQAGARRSVDLADYYRLETASSPAVSPDGRLVAFRAAQQLWVHSLESSA